jgi:hypothetical protein
MDPSVRNLIIMVLIAVLAIFVAFSYARVLLRKDLKKVVSIFREKQALSPESAKTREEIGIESPRMFNLKSFWDFKPTAFVVLMRSSVIQGTEDGRFFLSEKDLEAADTEKTIS